MLMNTQQRHITYPEDALFNVRLVHQNNCSCLMII